jgi:guanylate kinase
MIILEIYMNKGLLIILSGPSGVGKGTLRKRIMQDDSLNLAYSISMTTRPKREFEKDGVDYFFVDEDRFTTAIKNGELLEWAEFVGYRYGTPKLFVESLRLQGKNVFLEIEIEGAKQIMEAYKNDKLLSIFLMPPSFQDLEMRIKKRRTESADVIEQRLSKAQREMTLFKGYQHIVVNDSLEKAALHIIDIIHHEMKKFNGNQ